MSARKARMSAGSAALAIDPASATALVGLVALAIALASTTGQAGSVGLATALASTTGPAALVASAIVPASTTAPVGSVNRLSPWTSNRLAMFCENSSSSAWKVGSVVSRKVMSAPICPPLSCRVTSAPPSRIGGTPPPG